MAHGMDRKGSLAAIGNIWPGRIASLLPHAGAAQRHGLGTVASVIPYVERRSLLPLILRRERDADGAASAFHVHEPARQRARELVNTAAFVEAQRRRKKVEALFAELKNQIGLRRLRLRRLKFVREQFFLAAAAQNIKRLVRFLSHEPPPPLQATT